MILVLQRMTSNANVIKFFRRVLRFVVPLGAFAFLVYSLLQLPAEVFVLWKDNLIWSPAITALFSLLIILSFFNWSLEAVKWKMLSGKLEQVSFRMSLYGVLYGVTLGMVTPKRYGEFLGRTMILIPANRIRGMVINVAGSLSQLSITMVFGLLAVVAAIMLANPDSTFFDGHLLFQNPAFAIALVGLILVMAALFGARPVGRKINNHLSAPRWLKPFAIFHELKPIEMISLIGWSFLRYLIFIIQFYVFLVIFHVPVDLATAFLLLAISYLFLSPLPISAVVEAGVRGSVVLVVFELFFSRMSGIIPGVEISLVASMLGLWLVNLALPAMAGALLGVSGKISGIKDKA
ncbi:MAG: hypothetical protein R6U64_02705 [Bacteroidales bacterium]